MRPLWRRPRALTGLAVVAGALLAGCSGGAPAPRHSARAPVPATVSTVPPASSVPPASAGALPTASGGSRVVAPALRARHYPWHTRIVSTTFWVGEIFDPTAPDGSQVLSTYDAQWQRHYGGCDGRVVQRRCGTERRTAHNGFFPLHMTPRQNPFYLDLPYDDLNDPTGFAQRCRVIPWAHDPGYARRCADGSFSMMKNRWVEITGPNRRTCYGQIEDAGPGRYHDSRYAFGHNDARPANARYGGAGMDVSPALNGCLGFRELDGDTDRVSWRFVEAADVPPGPWRRLITRSGVVE